MTYLLVIIWFSISSFIGGLSVVYFINFLDSLKKNKDNGSKRLK